MSSEHAPLAGREFYSSAKNDFLMSEVREGLSRGAAMANVISSTRRPSNPDQSIWHGCANSDKGLSASVETPVPEEPEEMIPVEFFLGDSMLSGELYVTGFVLISGGMWLQLGNLSHSRVGNILYVSIPSEFNDNRIYIEATAAATMPYESDGTVEIAHKWDYNHGVVMMKSQPYD